MKTRFLTPVILVSIFLLITNKNSLAIHHLAVNAPAPQGNELIIANQDCCDQTKPAVARSSASGNYIVAWMDHNPTYPAEPERGQIFWKFLLNNGTISNSSYFYDGKYNSAPDIAYDSIHDRFLVVWENHCSDRHYWDISALQINASTGQVVGDITPIFRGESYHFRHPSVTFNPEDGEFLVAAELQSKHWTTDWDIIARRVIPKNDGTLEAIDYEIDETGIRLAQDFDPEIAPDVTYDDEANAYLTVWEMEPDDAPDKIQARIVASNGTKPGNITDIVANTFDAENPKVAFNTNADIGQFLVVYQEGGIHVVGQRVWSSYPTPLIANIPFDIAASSEDETKPDVAFNSACNCYLVTYDSEKNYLFKIFAQQVFGTHQDGSQLDGTALKVAEEQWGLGVGASIRNNAIACSPGSNQCLTVWEYGDSVRAVVDVHGQPLQCSYSGSASVFMPMVGNKFSGGTSYFDGFGDPNSGWGVGETDNYLVEYNNGEYRMVGKNADSIIRSTAPAGANCQNCSIEVDARFVGTTNNGYGIVFSYGQGAEAGNYYAFIAYPYADTCDLVKYQNYAASLMDRANCNLTEGVNNLKVEWYGTSFKTYTNNVLANNITQIGVYNNDAVGLIVYNQGDARFDNFRVTK